MPILPTRIDPLSETFIANRRAMLEKLERLAALQRQALLVSSLRGSPPRSSTNNS